MTQQQSGGSGRQSPGTHSPQAKLVQDLVHLLAPPPPHSSSHPIYIVSKVSHILHLALGLLISLLTLQRHFSPSLANHPPISFCCLFLLFCCEMQCDWEPLSLSGKGWNMWEHDVPVEEGQFKNSLVLNVPGSEENVLEKNHTSSMLSVWAPSPPLSLSHCLFISVFLWMTPCEIGCFFGPLSQGN